ncbi:DMT family transporter [Acidisphaera sp. S103]|uniref:DMT family transporter n=1 Tax=Acidisphaera sp. S103 TaxID=1747223 RepID=UPI00131BFD28|nr:DMT family transporter [Acidisphaera sp. S103]
MFNAIGYAAWAFLAGASIPVMAILNARAARILGGAVSATILLLIVGLVTAVALTPIFRSPVPKIGLLASMPVPLYMGGVIVALYIMSVTALAPRFGVANTVLFVVCAQIAAAAVIDAWGLFGAAVRPVTLMRAGGISIAILGVVLSQLGSSSVGSVR